ncbi:hypothetical protein WAF17_03815 [Bernardetia sp. ABR2-2B]|uniref:hypothetical protein n=1 Tax=Bernardetia sp. ABR2-2B TaxID=3127472 RepID=UPI0030CC70E9
MILSKSTFSFLILFFSSLVLFSSCTDDEDPEIPNEEELITTLTYTLVPEGGGSNVVLSFQDLDGDGGTAPVISGGTLMANTVYNGSIDLLNEAETPAESITAEIEEEDDEHQFFFATTGGLNATVAYADTDGTNPVGLKTTVTTTDASQGKLRVTLRHEPAKDAAGVSDGDITNAGGETDIEVEFDVTIE